MQVHTNYNNISSKGFIKSLTSDPFTSGFKRSIRGKSEYIGGLLGESSYAIDILTKDADAQKVSFLEALARKYLSRNHGLKYGEKENSKDVLDIYKAIEKPAPEHIDIVSRAADDFKTLKKILTLADSKESLSAVLDLQRNILKQSPNSSETIINLLSSDYKNSYVKNFDDYRSYLILNSKRADAVQNLDKLMKENKYDRKIFDAKLEINRLMRNQKVKGFIAGIEDNLAANYTEERGKFLKLLTTDYLSHKRQLKKVDSDKIFKMYLSTNSDNLALRSGILNKFKYLAKDSADGELGELRLLFSKIEGSEDARKFVQNSVDQSLPVDSVSELNTVMSQVELNKANYFFDNVKRIVALSSGEERKMALSNEIENPFFEPEERNFSRILGVRNNYDISGKFDKLKLKIKNKINMFLFKHFGSKNQAVQETAAPVEEKMKVVKTRADKVKLAQEANEYIKTKLGKRTYNEQEDIYRIKVTKMRLGMLPEMFASVKATRAEARAKGLIPQSSNKDIARLYELINGNNKKIVKYMLKKCDAKGNRIFDVKQIAELIESANKKSAINVDPVYRKSVTKDYYNSVYNSLTGLYGRL